MKKLKKFFLLAICACLIVTSSVSVISSPVEAKSLKQCFSGSSEVSIKSKKDGWFVMYYYCFVI